MFDSDYLKWDAQFVRVAALNEIAGGDWEDGATPCASGCDPRQLNRWAGVALHRPCPAVRSTIYRPRNKNGDGDFRAAPSRQQVISVTCCGGNHALAFSGACQGSMRSSAARSASANPLIRSCRQPVLRNMWIARGREGARFPLRISEA